MKKLLYSLLSVAVLCISASNVANATVSSFSTPSDKDVEMYTTLAIADLALVGDDANEVVNMNLYIPAGSLSFGSTTGLTFIGASHGNNLKFGGTVADINTALATLLYTPSNATGSYVLEATISDADGVVIWENNSHAYKVVIDSGIMSWNDAKTAAENQTFGGVSGYLATITSLAEHNFILTRINQNGWIGASDSAVEGEWRWVTGPEAGTQFWTGTTIGSGGGAVNGEFANWKFDEPNNSAGNEDCAQLRFMSGYQGQWNDLPCTDNAIKGYVVEFGALGAEPEVVSTSFTITVEEPAILCPHDQDACGPTNPVATGGNTVVDVSWDSPEIGTYMNPFPTFNDYNDVCYSSNPLADCFWNYALSVFSGDDQVGSTIEINTESTHSYQFTGLTNGQEYGFEVCVRYRNGENEPGDAICTTVYATPIAPTPPVTPPVNNGGGGGGGGGRSSSTSNTNTTTSASNTTTNTVDTDTAVHNVADDDNTTATVTSDDSKTSEIITETTTDTSLDSEVQSAYHFAFIHGLTTLSQEEARLTDPLNRAELAKMVVTFAKNVLGKTETQTCDITTYSDYESFDEEMTSVIQQACNLGIMGWKNDKSGLITTFRPFDLVTRAEFGAVLSRLLYGDTYNGSTDELWYQAHLEALQTNSVMKNIDTPFAYELRQWALVMFQRVGK